MNERERALRILERVDREEAFADPLIGRGGSREELFVRTLVLGVLRWRGRLDFLIEKLARRPLARIDSNALGILRLGLYQLLFTDVAPHAAVGESVGLATAHAPHAKGFINAVLRNATRTDIDSLLPAGDDDASLAVTYSHPGWLVTRWRRRFGPLRTKAILSALQELSYPDLLVNRGRISMEELEHQLAAKGIVTTRSPLTETMLRMKSGTGALSEEIESGLVLPMDEGSALVASLVGTASRKVLDATAAPGSKSVAMALAGHDVVSLDVSRRRLVPLLAAHRRFFGSIPKAVTGDARVLPFAGKRFDVVLLDAPCSATGTFRKNPEAKWRITSAQLSEFASLQRELLTAALTVADECLYSTCSLEPEENDEVVDAILASDDALERFDLAPRAKPALLPWIDSGVLRLTPEAGTDGFTAHGIRMRSAPTS